MSDLEVEVGSFLAEGSDSSLNISNTARGWKAS